MTTSLLSNQRIEGYLARLDAALAGISPSENREILSEIRAHILDSIAGAADRDLEADRVMHLLGEPEELAERYHVESLLTRAGRSYSPWLLLRTSWRWAKLGMRGTGVFLLALFGYTTAFALTITLFLKPFLPTRIGLWGGPEGLNVGIPAHPEEMHELLGPWFVPVIAALAFAIAVGTTHALRKLIRKRSPTTASSAGETWGHR